MAKCSWINTSVVIDAQGFMKPCCNMGGSALFDKMKSTKDIHIDDIDSINESYFYNGFLSYLRKSLDENGIEGTSECVNCKFQLEKKVISHWHRGENNVGHFVPDGKVKFLEMTTSNICNQTCITCSPYFSSKWETIQHLFEDAGTNQDHVKYGKKYNLTEDGLKKIFEILPTLEILLLKGGEPFSDLRNLKVLEELAIVNPTCQVWVTTNASIVSNKFLDVLSKLKEVSINASLDHIGKKYEWIRGTSFEQTLNTIERIYDSTGRKVRVAPTISYFNVLDIKNEIGDFYKQFKFTDWNFPDFSEHNFVHWPKEMDFHNTRTQEELDTVGENLISRFDPLMYGTLMRKIEIMNGIRGFRWQDC